MPVIYEIDADKGIRRTRCVGDVKVQEVVDHFRTLAQDPKAHELANVLLDLSELTSLPSASHLLSVTSEMKKVRDRVPVGACAIVADREALFGMMRMFEVLAGNFFRVVQIFRTVAAAEAWLSAQSEKA